MGDSAYGGKSVTRRVPEGAVCISRLPMHAALYDVSVPPALEMDFLVGQDA